jgi:pyruvate formate lyase activating enzyme
MITAPVNKIIPFSCVDGPGNRTAVFLQGCNQACLYCHNPETIAMCSSCGACVAVCPAGALSLEEGKVAYDITKCCLCDACLKACPNLSSPRIREMTAEQVMGEIAVNLPFISGVTVSGGECSLHPDFIRELFTLVREKGKTTFIDTNGQTPLWEQEALLAVTDKTMIDLKSADDDEHRRMSGLSAALPMENIRRLAPLGKIYEIRTVVVPGLLDNRRTVETGARLIAPYPDIRYKLIRYRPFGVRPAMPETPVPTDEEMAELEALARSCGVQDVCVV